MKTPSHSRCTITPARLRCEALTNPSAVASKNPRLSWIIESDRHDQIQTSYQVTVSSSAEKLAQDEADLWDSGKVNSQETINIEYQGHPLTSGQRCWWKVRVWDKPGNSSDWAGAAFFGAGLLPSDWTSEWIGFDKTHELNLPPAPFEGASWIWLGDEVSERRKGVLVGSLHLPDDFVMEHSQMALSVAGRFRFFWRGEQFAMNDAEPESWRRPYIRHLNERLHPGANEFYVHAEQVDDEPPGLLFKVVVKGKDGLTYTMVSDENWRSTNEWEPTSTNATTDAENLTHSAKATTASAEWPSCRVVANYGQSPWGLLQGQENILPPPALLRGNIAIQKSIRRGTFHATALGIYDLHLNGERVNVSYFDPGWTDYRKRVYYRAYDVTSLLQPGDNAVGVVLADGWFSGYVGWGHQRDIYGRFPRFRGQLHLEFEDGTSQIMGTDSTWVATIGPIKEADMLMGEVYDARDEIPGWDRAGFDASAWHAVDTGAAIAPLLQPHPGQPVVALESEKFTPRSMTEPKEGVFIFDLGQNFAGIVILRLRDTSPGQQIILRYGERLQDDGSLYTINLRTARATDTYICRGAAEETWSPRFTFHGFQYVEVSGLTQKPHLETLTGLPLSTDTPFVGTFECSDVLANRLASNVYWSQRSNYLEIPTDCPQRDERLGWCDGAWTFIGAASLRTDVQNFYGKWLTDLDDAQREDGLFPWLAPLVVATPERGGAMWEGCSPAWLDAGVICPWEIYKIYGDRRQLSEHYPAMVRQVEWYRNTSRPNLLPQESHKCLGDWLNYNAPIPPDVFRTAFFAYSTGLVAQSARILGKTEDAIRYGKLHSALKAAFHDAYVDSEGRIPGDTQSGYAFALVFGLLDGPSAELAAKHLVENIERHEWRPTTGLEGTLPLMLALSQIGRNDVAYRILHNETFPSWNYSIKNGATSIWERWDSWTPEKGFGDPNMNSFNHFSIGAVYQWMVENIGGIRQAGVAYDQVIIAPSPGGKLTNARTSYDSIRGLIRTDWKLNGEHLELEIVIPANTTARVILPATNPESIKEKGQILSRFSTPSTCVDSPGRVRLDLGSGLYHFQIHRPLMA